MKEGYLYENGFALSVDPSEGVASVSREMVTIRRGMVGEEHETRVIGFRHVGEEVEPCVYRSALDKG